MSKFLCLTLFITVVILECSFAQSQFRARVEDELHPVYRIRQGRPYFMIDGKIDRGTFRRLDLVKDEEFGDGFVEIETLVSEYRETKERSRSGETNAEQSYLHHEIKLTSKTKIQSSYCVLTFSVNGSIGTYWKEIGVLSAGKPKKITLTPQLSGAEIGNVHIYSFAKEIRTSQLPSPYDLLKDELEPLSAKTRGVPVNLLWAEKESYPHSLSQDGKYLATFRDVGKTNVVYVFDTDTGTIHRKIEIGEAYEEIHSLTWVSDQEFVFTIGDILKRVHLEKDGVEDILKNVTHIIHDMPGDPNRLLLANVHPSTAYYCTFNLKSKKKSIDSEVRRDAVIPWFDQSGAFRLKANVEGKVVEYFYRETRSGRWKPLDDTVKQEGITFNFTGDSILEQEIYVDRFGSDPDKLLVYSHVQSDTSQLAEYSISEGKITKYFLGSSIYDLGGGAFREDSSILYRKTSNDPIGLLYMGSKPTVKWFVPEFIQAQKIFDSANPDTANIPIDWTDDASVIIYRMESDQHPGKYILFKPGVPSASLIYDALPGLKGRTLGNTEPIKYETRDGYTIRGYLTLPPSHEGQSVPLIAYPHGGPWVRDTWTYDPYVQYFATRGYAVFQPNFRGSVGYGREHTIAGTEGVDTVMIDDVADGVRYLIESGIADKNRIAIFGGSFGGYSVYMGLIRYPELYQSGVAFAAVSDFREMLKNERWSGNKVSYDFWKTALGDFKDDDLMERVSAAGHAEKIKSPLLIFHGKLDPVVPPKQAEIMRKALVEVNATFKLTYFEDEGHGFYFDANRARFLGETELFFREHLGL